jgi:MFS family permease
MWLIYLVNAFQSSITSNLAAYIASDFEDAPLVTVIGTVSSIMATAMTMPIARMLNVWDRGNGFLFLAAIATLGLILSAACNSLPVYCAAQVFYYVGFQGLIFCVDVITLDTSTLRDRGLAYAFTSSPYIISAFAGPKAAEGFNDYNWRWGYGCFAIILPFVCIPLYGTLLYNKKKAIASGALIQPVSDKKSVKAWLWDFIIEFDCECD